MTTLNDSSRRAFLTALAASGAAAAVIAAPGTAHAADETGGVTDPGAPAAPGPVLRTEAFPAPTSGTSYRFYLGGAFIGTSDEPDFTKSFGQVTNNAVFSTYFLALDDLPTGARVTEVSFAVIKNGVPTVSCSVFQMIGGTDVNLLDSQSSSALPNSADEQYLNLVVDPANPAWVIDNQQTYSHWLVLNSAVNSRVNSVRVGYIPGPTSPLSFVPIAPKRAYDSRFVAPLGPLANNTNRVISVANSFVAGTGTLEQANIIPPTARAIAYNLTIANTVGSGFLSVNPGDAVNPGGSSINWFQSGMSLANGLVGSLDNARQIKVFCGGGGSTDFIVDINGYYL